MKLWEAILLGSQIRPQTFTRPFDDIGSCAWGAAWEAVGLRDWILSYGCNVEEKLIELGWLQVTDKAHTCPVCGYKEDGCAIAHLNDAHYWTRERIALEFVKPMEEALAVEAVAPAPVTEAVEA